MEVSKEIVTFWDMMLCSPEGRELLRNIAIEPRSRDSSVGVATGYGLDDSCSNPSWANILLYSSTSRPALGPTKPPIQVVPRSISKGIKRPGREADNSHPSSREYVDLYIHSQICFECVVLN
jgi:hypothetical protein